jgi:hypothetical protein
MAIRGRDVLTALFEGCGGLVEVRALPSRARVFAPPSDETMIANWLKDHRLENLYFGVATRRDESGGSLEHCQHLGALFVDVDLKDGRTLADARQTLAACPLAPSIVIQSGGGLHCYWLLREPVDVQDDPAGLTHTLRRLATLVQGDLAAAEPARILRVPGMFNHKYTPARPVAIEAFEPDQRINISDFDEFLPALPRQRSAAALGLQEDIQRGQRDDTLYRLARALRQKQLPAVAVAEAIRNVNATRCNPPLEEGDVDRLIKHALVQADRSDFKQDTGATRPDRPRTIQVTPASQIRMRPVRWLWDKRLGLGTFALLGGREGIGKTIYAYTLAAAVTRGTLSGVFAGTPRTVIVAATEDSWEHTIVPRLTGAEACLDRVYRVDVTTAEGVETALSLPRDLAELERVIGETQAVLVILDPLLSRLDAELDTHKDAEVRLALEPLVTIAHASDACVLGLTHVNKSSSSDALTLLMGSRAFAAVARAVLFVMVDPEDETQRLLGQPKNNLGRLDLPTLSFRIHNTLVATTDEGEVWTGRLEWTGERDLSIREAVEAAAQQTGERTASAEAADWLHDYLTSQGGSADSAAAKRAGKDAGHSVPALHRARLRLHVKVASHGFPCRTYWTLPAAVSLAGETGTAGTTETTGKTSEKHSGAVVSLIERAMGGDGSVVAPDADKSTTETTGKTLGNLPVVSVVPVVSDPPRARERSDSVHIPVVLAPTADASDMSEPCSPEVAADADLPPCLQALTTDTADPIGAHDAEAEAAAIGAELRRELKASGLPVASIRAEPIPEPPAPRSQLTADCWRGRLPGPADPPVGISREAWARMRRDERPS